MTIPIIMISSTARDLLQHRKAAKDACNGLGCHPVMMEDLPALDADAIDASLKMVDDSTVYLGIFAHRYGYVPNDPRNPDRISITEMEYNRAVELGKPRLIFVVSADHAPGLEVESGPGADKLAAFMDRLMTDRVVKFFASGDQLQAHITQAVAHWLQLRTTWMPDPLPEPGFLPETHLLPPGSRVGMPRNIHFVGREDSLVALAETLLHGADDAKTVITPAAAATGSGGIGKTQLAIEFAHRYGRYFQGVHWINLLGVEGDRLDAHLRAEIGACGAAMGLPNYPENDLPEQVKLTLDMWRQSPPRLVILDNAETPEVVRYVLGTLAGSRVLVTSRWGKLRDWQNAGVDPRALDMLTRDQSIDLLRRLAPHLLDTADVELDALAARLGDFPLALDLAARYLDDMYTEGEPVSVLDFLAALEASALDHSALKDWSVQAEHSNPTQHDMDVRATFLVSWRRVTDPLAQRLFRACGYLAPNSPIPADLLRAVAGERGAPLVQARRQLAQPGLLTPHTADEPLLAIHPLLADFARDMDAQEDAESGGVSLAASTLVRVADALARVAKQANDTGLPASFVPLRPHVEVAAPRADAAEIDDAASLWSNLGYHMKMIADYAAAREYHARALAMRERILPADHPSVATSLNNLASVLYAVGDLPAAQEHYARVLSILERTLPPDHPYVASTLNNLASVLYTVGDLSAAQEHYERALAILERTLPADHPNVASTLNNLGSVLHAMGDLPAAQEHYERALTIRQCVYGPEHPGVAQSLNNLGKLLQALGDLPAARQHLERALAIDERVYGPEHPEVAQSLSNLGQLLQALGDLPTARQHYERALAIDERVYGSDHPGVAQSLNNLGGLLYILGDLPAARQHYERALTIRQRVYGPEHPGVAQSLNNLGKLLQALGDLPAARQHFEHALAIDENVYGSDHPQVAQSLSNLGMLLKALGDLPTARQHYERALAIDERVYGSDHPEVAIDLNNLGALLYALGDLPAARQHYERAFAIRQRVYGPDHPDVAQSLNNLGMLLKALGDLSAARQHVERAFAIDERVYGPDHPEVATDLNNLGALLYALGDLPAARQHYKRAIAIWEKVLGAEHPQVATGLSNLGSLHQELGDRAAARACFERALHTREQALPLGHPSIENVRRKLAGLG